MPVAYVDLQSGLSADAKKRLVRDMEATMHASGKAAR